MFKAFAIFGTAVCLAGTPSAQAVLYRFDIPSQPLGSALRLFGIASQQQIAFDEDAVQGRQSAPVHGRYTARGAMAVMVKDPDLAVSRTSNGVFIIRRADSYPTPRIARP